MWDVIIVGAGPAGSTVAATLLTYRPSARVLIVEREAFPRFHIGESLVSEVNRVLEEMGAYDAVHDAGFVRKYGATFVWGQDREPWDLVFGDLPAGARPGTVQTSYTWHVRRDRYDKILLDRAQELGASVRRGAASRLEERDGRVVGVWVDDTMLEGRYVVDATGQSGLGGGASKRSPDPFLRNIAYFGYYRGFRGVPRWTGEADRSHAFIVAHDAGWAWMFPVEPDLMSVGVVTRLAHHQPAESPEAYLRAAVASSPEMRTILDGATLEPHFGRSVRVMKDFSYMSEEIVRPGLARVGDAAGFIDPILSVGCFLGQSGARLLAYALNTALTGSPDLEESRIFEAYADQVRDTVRAYRQLSYFFYLHSNHKTAWWDEARALLQDSATWTHDRNALLAFATGFAAQKSVFREATAAFDACFFVSAYDHFTQGDAGTTSVDVALSPDDVIVLNGALTLRDSAVPLDGMGRFRRSLRVEVLTDQADQAGVPTRMHVSPDIRPMFEHLDGGTSVRELAAAVSAAPASGTHQAAQAERYARSVLETLVARGLARVDATSQTPSRAATDG